MKILVLLPALIVWWPILRIMRKGWRLFAALCFAALITGCTSTSDRFDRSPCACLFNPLNTQNDGNNADA